MHRKLQDVAASDVVDAPPLQAFKSRLDVIWQNRINFFSIEFVKIEQLWLAKTR